MRIKFKSLLMKSKVARRNEECARWQTWTTKKSRSLTSQSSLPKKKTWQ